MKPAAEVKRPTAGENDCARLVIAAPQGRSGKTTVSLGLCAAFAGRGIAVQPFKKGPDFIDPSWLSAAAGTPCRCLDPFFLPEPGMLRAAFLHGARQANLALIEGNHGLFDSLEDDGAGSTAAVARAVGAPIVLVINAQRMARSAAAIVHGCQTFEPGTPIAAVILNQVAQNRHESKLRSAIERHCGIPVVGALPRDLELTIPDRHLGLVPQAENEGLAGAIEACRTAVETHIDLDALLKIGRNPLDAYAAPNPSGAGIFTGKIDSTHAELVRVGVVRDRAFTFYYPENFEMLESCGAELIFLDSLHDRRLPELDALYIGGGFPEMFLDEISANRGWMDDVRRAIQDGLPVYAECGGLMVLGQSISYRGRSVPMIGALPYRVEMTERPQGHGYVLATVTEPNPIFKTGAVLRGHEFHHSHMITGELDRSGILELSRGTGIDGRRDGLVYGSAYVGYTHLHAYGAPAWAPGFIGAARRWRSSQ